MLRSFFILATVCAFALVESRGRKSGHNHAFKVPMSLALHEFAFDFYTKLSPNWGPQENIVLSPISYYEVLSILAPGLGGESRKQVYKALRFTQFPNPEEHQAQMIESVFDDDQSCTLKGANRIFVDNSMHVKKLYKKESVDHHKVAVKKLNFAGSPNAARTRINKYISRHTDQEIKELVPEGAITSLTKIYLVNAVYLNASWKIAFRPLRHRQTFHVSPSEQVETNMMMAYQIDCSFGINFELESSYVILPFKEKELTMVIFSPLAAGNFRHFENNQTATKIRQTLQKEWDYNGSDGYPRMTPCAVTMPKFSIKHKVSSEALTSALEDMTVTDIFDADLADFSEMTSEEGLYVEDTRHEASIEVSEYGVKAVAASSVGVGMRMIPMPITIERPFMFMIRHEKTGAVLFTGRFVRP
ncbi:unnamed protein product [Clavelina lepadiformis]|uniref:Serpin domain-containing protein n=1 Tax=Clavelina lepadiformis TaxID=159417 RepID=A0ABP0GM24_CLALP